MTQNSKIFSIAEEPYRAIDAVSASDLKLIGTSNERKLWLARNGTREESDDMDFGTDFHTAMLEPEKFLDTYACEPDRMPDGREAGVGEGKINRNTKEWKEFMNEWRALNASKKCIDPRDFTLIRNMMTAVGRHPRVPALIRECQREVGTLWRAPSGTQCKAKADLAGVILADFKTTKCRTPNEFMNDCYRRLVHVQLSFYEWGFNTNGLVFEDVYAIGVTKNDKFTEQDVFLIRYDERLMERGREKMYKLLERYEKASLSDKWPGFDDEYTATIPPWDLIDL